MLIVEEIEEEFKHPEMVHSSGKQMELDVYIEKLKLAIEYQGEQHYSPIHWVSDFAAQKQRDKEKLEACKKVQSVSVLTSRIILLS